MTSSPTLILLPEAANALIAQLDFAKEPLLPVLVMDHMSGDLLMQAWMNEESLFYTLTNGKGCYYSRSRQGLWIKGETSGHTQRVVRMRIDCDYDSIQMYVEQQGAACHTHRASCFYFEVQGDGSLKTMMNPIVS